MNSREKIRLIIVAIIISILLTAAMAGLLFTMSLYDQTPPKVSSQEAYEIGMKAYVYFYPFVSIDVTWRSLTKVPAATNPGL